MLSSGYFKVKKHLQTCLKELSNSRYAYFQQSSQQQQQQQRVGMISGKKLSSQRELIMNKVNIPSPMNGVSSYPNGNLPIQEPSQQTRYGY